LTPPPCEVCGHPGTSVWVPDGRDYFLGNRAEGFRALRCTSCGFAFLESPPDDLSRYYPGQYFSLLGEAPPGLRWMKKALAGREARWLHARVPAASSILEVGPGEGTFLHAIRGAYRASRIQGFDVTAEAGLPQLVAPDVRVTYAKALGAAGFGDGEFDLVVMRHVLEHVPDLGGLLREVGRVTRAGATLYVKVPNRSSWAAQLFGRYWYGFDFPRHLRYLSVPDLASMLGRAGFRLIAAGHETDAIDWVGSLRFLCADRLGLPVRAGPVIGLAFLGVRILLLPLALLARAAQRSSRVWVLARKEGA
jgi:SAM-dependent methyltransferase